MIAFLLSFALFQKCGTVCCIWTTPFCWADRRVPITVLKPILRSPCPLTTTPPRSAQMFLSPLVVNFRIVWMQPWFFLLAVPVVAQNSPPLDPLKMFAYTAVRPSISQNPRKSIPHVAVQAVGAVPRSSSWASISWTAVMRCSNAVSNRKVDIPLIEPGRYRILF
jgi:hypothetical protein